MSTIHSWSQIQSQLRNPENPVVFFGKSKSPQQIGAYKEKSVKQNI